MYVLSFLIQYGRLILLLLATQHDTQLSHMLLYSLANRFGNVHSPFTISLTFQLLEFLSSQCQLRRQACHTFSRNFHKILRGLFTLTVCCLATNDNDDLSLHLGREREREDKWQNILFALSPPSLFHSCPGFAPSLISFFWHCTLDFFHVYNVCSEISRICAFYRIRCVIQEFLDCAAIYRMSLNPGIPTLRIAFYRMRRFLESTEHIYTCTYIYIESFNISLLLPFFVTMSS